MVRSPISDLRFPLFHERDDLTGPRVSIEFRLLEDGNTIPMHLKPAAARRHELHDGIAELALDIGRQTDGPRFVVSNRAVLDRDIHGCRRGERELARGNGQAGQVCQLPYQGILARNHAAQ